MVSLVPPDTKVEIGSTNKALHRQCLLDTAARPTMVNQTSMLEHGQALPLLDPMMPPLSMPGRLSIKSQILSSLAEGNKSFGRRYTSLEYQELTNTLNCRK